MSRLKRQDKERRMKGLLDKIERALGNFIRLEMKFFEATIQGYWKAVLWLFLSISLMITGNIMRLLWEDPKDSWDNIFTLAGIEILTLYVSLKILYLAEKWAIDHFG